MSAQYQQRLPPQNQYFRGHGAQAAPGPPLDDTEHWFILPAPNNRMLLALQCGIISEVSWSLNRLLRLSASERFVLGQFPTLPDALCHWPEWFLEHADDEDSSSFSPSPEYVIHRRLALNSLLVLKNASLGDEGGSILGKSKRLRSLIFDTLEKFQIPNDSKLEFLLTAMDLFRYTIRHWPAPPTVQQTTCLVEIVGRSHDRAILISGWSGLHNLLDTFTTVMHVTPTCAALDAAIRALPLHIDPHLVGAALDYILAHISNPSLAKAFLHHRDMPQVLKLLVHQLLWDQNKVLDSITVTIGPPPKTVIAQNNAIGMLELSKEELDEMAPLTEPSRVTKWMQRVFEVSPQAEMTQVDFWNLYKGAFSSYGMDSMLSATELIKLVTTIFPTAMAMVIAGQGGKPPKFVIKGLERRRAAAEGRTKCHWDRWGCPEPPFLTPVDLYAHVKTHTALTPTRTCLWGSCTHESSTEALFEAHLLTHLPLQLFSQRHPGQVDDVLVPANSEAHVSTPTARPPPPGPPQPLTYPKPREDPPATSFCALLIMRTIFRSSFVHGEVVMKTDNDHFGFPGVEQAVNDGEDAPAADSLGYDDVEGQRRGRAAFMAVGSLLSRVYIHDAAISTWIDEMLDSIKALPPKV